MSRLAWFLFAVWVAVSIVALVLTSGEEDRLVRGVVRDTVQPAHISLWLRSEP